MVEWLGEQFDAEKFDLDKVKHWLKGYIQRDTPSIIRNWKKCPLSLWQWEEIQNSVVKANLPSSAGDTISHRAYFTTGKSSTAGVSLTTSLPKKRLLRTIERLERLVGRLTLENEFLKRGLQRSLSQSQRNGKPSVGGNTSSAVSGGGVG
ncbi:hypothetical protein M1N86_01445 [Dehalococcoidia bacterium]|nr:hypothetical protein [Dehalococcoidia bacterium]